MSKSLATLSTPSPSFNLFDLDFEHFTLLYDLLYLTLLAKTQTLLDRMVFIFFAEDRALFHFYKIYFKAINEGNDKINITEYNGGLFAEDSLINSLIIDDEVLDACPLALSAYDFNTDVDIL